MFVVVVVVVVVVSGINNSKLNMTPCFLFYFMLFLNFMFLCVIFVIKIILVAAVITFLCVIRNITIIVIVVAIIIVFVDDGVAVLFCHSVTYYTRIENCGSKSLRLSLLVFLTCVKKEEQVHRDDRNNPRNRILQAVPAIRSTKNI